MVDGMKGRNHWFVNKHFVPSVRPKATLFRGVRPPHKSRFIVDRYRRGDFAWPFTLSLFALLVVLLLVSIPNE